jgi:predicted glutamine amidotransferase
MCRWIGYLGGPIPPREMLHDPRRSLIEQSRRHAPNMEIPNGDGTGRAWYEYRAEPAPPVQQTNCQPFRYRSWTFVHNGYVAEYHELRREVLLAVAPPDRKSLRFGELRQKPLCGLDAWAQPVHRSNPVHGQCSSGYFDFDHDVRGKHREDLVQG